MAWVTPGWASDDSAEPTTVICGPRPQGLIGVLGGVGGFRVVGLIGLIAFRLNACGFMRILSKGL